MCTVLPPQAGYPIAVNKYINHIISHHIISYHIISYHIISYHIVYHIISYHIISYHTLSYHITTTTMPPSSPQNHLYLTSPKFCNINLYVLLSCHNNRVLRSNPLKPIACRTSIAYPTVCFHGFLSKHQAEATS